MLLFPQWVTFFIFIHSFDSISSNMDEVLSINPSANVFQSSLFDRTHTHIPARTVVCTLPLSAVCGEGGGGGVELLPNFQKRGGGGLTGPQL